jgi:hypothetical protein
LEANLVRRRLASQARSKYRARTFFERRIWQVVRGYPRQLQGVKPW